jgi:predicted unusual protein kinase regulating ubiquinone biosynthesis (AarF/ABC1/UbiB family)
MRDGEHGPRTGWGRTWTTLKMAARLGASAAGQQLGLAGSDSPEKAVSKALDLVAQMDGMKGLMMKFGQMASYLDVSLPPEARDVLAVLQSSASAMSREQVRAQLQQGLGAPAEALFDEFHWTPRAAASIGQVHQARWAGRDVAVKVQYPGIASLIRADLRNVGGIAGLALLGTAMDGGGLVEELAARLNEECDYLLEASRQQAIGALWNTREGSRVPAVYPERCGSVVLTSDWVAGLAFRDFRDASAVARHRAGRIIFRNVFDGIFRRGFFNGDPHPGNYLFSPEGDVTFLDFGCVKVFDDDLLARWKRMAKTVLDDDRAGFAGAIEALGFVGDHRRFDFDFQWRVMNHVYKPFKARESFRYSGEYVAESNRLLLWQNENRRAARIPPDMLFVNRLQWGLNSLLAELRVEGVFTDLFREAVESPIERVPGLS